jgi:PAS domain S-box-containing protein
MIAPSISEIAVVLAPLGRDAAIASAVLGEAGISAVIVADVDSLVDQLSTNAAFAVVTEEALHGSDLRRLSAWLMGQPEWSDLPVILLTPHGGSIERNPAAARYLETLGNVTFIERPFHPTTLVSLAKAALRGRRRQFEARSRVETIRLGEQQLRIALSAGRLGAWSLDLSSQCLDASAQCKAHYGHEADEPFSYDDLLNTIHPGDCDYVRTSMDRAIAGLEDYDVEYRCIWPDGEVRWVLVRGRVDSGLDDYPRSMSGVSLSITERKNVEAELQRSEERFRAAVAAVQGVVWTNSASGEMRGEQPGWARLTGQSFEAYQNFGWADAVHPLDAQPTIDEWQLAVAKRRPFVFEHRLRMASGEWGIFSVRAVPAFEQDGSIREWVGVHTDITQQRSTEAELLAERERAHEAARQLNQLNTELESRVTERTQALSRSNRRLEEEIAQREIAQAAAAQSQKLEALGLLTAGVAHDFNNILAAVFAVMRLIEKRTDDPAIHDLLGHGQTAGERGKAIIAQLLAFARQQPMAPASINMKAAADDLKALIGQAIGAQVKVELECQDDVWPGYADMTQLQVAVLNLAVNARDAMQDGGTVAITIANASAGLLGHPPELRGKDAVGIAVHDTGSGIAPDVLERVLEPFYTTKPIGKGTGLGLAMVHGFATQSGGALQIESRVDEGTTITIYIPRGDANLTIEEPAKAEIGLGGVSGKTLLLVDDDDTLRFVTASELREAGYRVIDANGAAQALDLISRSAVDVAVLDVMMPEMNGPTLAKKMRATRPDLPILFMTARPDHPGLEREFVVAKPASAHEIVKRISQLLTAQTADSEPL